MAEDGWHVCGLLCLQTSLVVLLVSFPRVDTVSQVVLDSTVYSSAFVGQFNNYGSVRLFKFDVPLGTSYASWTLLANRSQPACPNKDIVMSLQPGGYPLVNPLNETFPKNFYLHRTHLQLISMKSNGSLHVHNVISPLTGTWYGAAYALEDVSSIIKSLARGKCSYTLAVNMTCMGWEDIPELLVDARQSPQRFTMVPNQQTAYLRFKIDKHAWWYEVNITRCVRGNIPMDTCPLHLYGRSQALPGDRLDSYFINCSAVAKGDACRLQVPGPRTGQFQYLRLVKLGRSNITFDISVRTKECGNVSGSFFAADKESNTVKRAKRSPDDDDIVIAPRIHKGFGDICVSYLKLFRTTEAQNNFITTYAIRASQQEFVENIAPIPSIFARVFQFDVKPMQDIGGTLRFSIEFNNTESLLRRKVLTNISVCIQRGVIPVTGSGLRCHPRDYLHISSISPSFYTALRYFPYPEEGAWYIVMQQICSSVNTTAGEVQSEDCPGFMLPVKFDLRSMACVEQGCGQYGVCREFLGASYAFSTCQCRADVTGYQCQDWSHALPRRTQLLFTLLLSTSNLLFIPAVIVGICRKRYPESFIYFANMFFSSFYHACDMGPWSVYVLCIMPYHVLSYCDFFCSIMSFWVTLIAVSEIRQPLYSLAHMVGVVALAMGVEWKQFGIITYAVPVGIGLVIVLVNYVVKSCQRKKWYPGKRRCLFLVPGLLLALVGICLYALIETDKNYPYTHSAWHACMALSIIFFLPARKISPNSSETSSESEEYTNSILEFQQETNDNDMVSLVPADNVDFSSVYKEED